MFEVNTGRELAGSVLFTSITTQGHPLQAKGRNASRVPSGNTLGGKGVGSPRDGNKSSSENRCGKVNQHIRRGSKIRTGETEGRQ